jgi:hypothetical protein
MKTRLDHLDIRSFLKVESLLVLIEVYSYLLYRFIHIIRKDLTPKSPMTKRVTTRHSHTMTIIMLTLYFSVSTPTITYDPNQPYFKISRIIFRDIVIYSTSYIAIETLVSS